MNRVAIAFSTCDRVELSCQSIEPFLQPDKFDLHWVDGSKTDAGIVLPTKYRTHGDNITHHSNVRGGSGAAIVFALTAMLGACRAKSHGAQGFSVDTAPYDYIGLVENDVVLPHDWFDKTMALFEQGKTDGLEVGAVSARCYEDRILIQRPDYAICHNLGAGMIVFTREAAELVLQHYRTQFTTENRQTFSLLAGIDIASYWAFRGSEHWLVADWKWDALLARHGLTSLALTPSPVQMVGQIPPLEEQGLRLAGNMLQTTNSERDFKLYRDNLQRIHERKLILPSTLFHRDQIGSYTIFAHQIGALGGTCQGNWKLKDSPGFGPFGWIADSAQEDWDPRITIPIFGPCEILIGGGKDGGQVQITDEQTGFVAKPVLPPEGEQGQIVSVNIPGNVAYRTISIRMNTPGSVFYGIRTRDEQPLVSNWKFDWNTLPHGRTEL